MRPLLLDSPSLIIRSVMATVQADMKACPGVWTGGVFTAIRTLARFLYTYPDIGPVYAFFDGGIPAFRKKLVPEYKRERKEKRQMLTDEQYEKAFGQVGTAADFLECLQARCIVEEGYEADDLIAMATHLLHEKGIRPAIFSTDKDLWQLVDKADIYRQISDYHKPKFHGTDISDDTVESPEEKPKPENWITADRFEEITGVPSSMWLLYKTLKGDPSDGLKGAEKCGEVLGKKLCSAIRRQVEKLPPMDQLSALVRILDGRKEKKKFELALCDHEKRLKKEMQAIDLSWSLNAGMRDTLEEQMKAPFQSVDFMDFVGRCNALKFASFMRDPDAVTNPFDRAAGMENPFLVTV